MTVALNFDRFGPEVVEAAQRNELYLLDIDLNDISDVDQQDLDK